MKNNQEYLITPTSKRTAVFMFVGTFVSAFLFLFGLVISATTFAPFLNTLLHPFPDRVAELPLSPDRLVPFATPDPEIIINPYPIQVPLTPAYNAAEATQNWIRIPTIGVNVPLIQSPSLADADVIKTLEQGAALYPNGVTPGALGNTFISAHSTGEPWKGAFRFAFIRINELKNGDAMYVDWRGARYAYRIVKSEIITPTADFKVISDRPVPTISLMACWPLWSTSKRMLIHAELTNVTQLTRPVAA